MMEHGHPPKSLSLSGSQSQSKYLENPIPIPTPIAIERERRAGAALFAKGGLKSTLRAAVRQLVVAGPDLYLSKWQRSLFWGTTTPEYPKPLMHINFLLEYTHAQA
jgi:hypothetical protein